MSEANELERVAADGAPLIPQPHGGVLRRGGKKGNKGGGRTPDEFKTMMAELASTRSTVAAVKKILKNPDHPHFMNAWKWATERGFGKVAEPIDLRIGPLEEMSDDELRALAAGNIPR